MSEQTPIQPHTSEPHTSEPHTSEPHTSEPDREGRAPEHGTRPTSGPSEEGESAMDRADAVNGEPDAVET